MILSQEVWRLCENCVAEVWGSMDKTFWTIFLAIVSVFSGIITLINHFNKPDLYERRKRENRERYDSITIANLLAFFDVYKTKLISATIAAFSAIAFVLILLLMPPSDDSNITVIEDTISPSSTPTIILESGNDSTMLEDLDPLNIDPDTAFYFRQWETNFPIKIDNEEYLHSIGVRLPVEVKNDFKDNHVTERKDYSAQIEYSLGYKYDTLQFQYGIDDNAFKDSRLPPPACHYWIVVESCICREDSEVKSIELYRTPEVNYMQTIGTSEIIDVSNVETLRITFNWLFDVLPTKPLTLNVAIVDPILNS